MGFYPRPPYGGRRGRRMAGWVGNGFYPRPPYGGRPARRTRWLWTCSFYPRPPYGGRPGSLCFCFRKKLFLSSPSIRRATTMSARERAGARFLSSPSIRRATPMRHDAMFKPDVSILALHTEGDGTACSCSPSRRTFLSSPSIRRATWPADFLPQPARFYPRPPYGGRPAPAQHGIGGKRVSILALHTEGDSRAWRPAAARRRFLSSPSIRRATQAAANYAKCSPVSILALHTEGDCRSAAPIPVFDVSILALHTEGDQSAGARRGQAYRFYPRPPYGGRRQLAIACIHRRTVSILALHTEGDGYRTINGQLVPVSILALHTEGDTQFPAWADIPEVSILALHTEGDAFAYPICPE